MSAGFVRRIVGVPKAESDAILNLLFHQISENPDFQVRFHWERNSIAIWDNRVCLNPTSSLFIYRTRKPEEMLTSESDRLSLIPLRLTSTRTPATPCARLLMARDPFLWPSMRSPAKSPRTVSWRFGSSKVSLSRIPPSKARATSLEGTMIRVVLPSKGRNEKSNAENVSSDVCQMYVEYPPAFHSRIISRITRYHYLYWKVSF